jgi:hypothetical protein
MADRSHRARYTALSNTLIGLWLVAGGMLGFLADAHGPEAALGVLAGACLLGIPFAAKLDEVQKPRG